MIGQGNVPGPLVLRTAWTLLHFLWQGAALWVVAAAVLRLLSGRSANVRYLAACAGLLVMASLPLVTFVALDATERASPGAEAYSEIGPGHDGHGELSPGGAEAVSPGLSPLPPAPLPASRGRTSSRQDVRLERHYEAAMGWLVWGWLAGVVLLSLRLLRGWLRIHRLKTRGAVPVGDPWQQKLAELAKLMGVDRAVQLLRCATAEVPTVVGWLRPAILVPASVLTALPPADLEAILLHELAHIRRHDYAINLLQTVVETVLFYHPGVWWLSRVIRIEREHCCDDLAVSIHEDKIGYARALARLAESGCLGDQLAPAAGGGRLFDRIRRLVGHPVDRGRGPAVWGASAAALAVIAVAVCGHLLIAADRDERRSGEGAEQRDGASGVASGTTTVTGRVVDPAGKALSGVRVRLVRLMMEGQGRRQRATPANQATTAANGSFLLTKGEDPADPRASAVVLAEKAGYGLAWGTRYPFVPGPMTIRMAEPRTLAGTVVDEKGRGLEGATVSICAARTGRGAEDQHITGTSAAQAFTTRTGADGAFLITGLPEGASVELVVRAPGRGTACTFDLTDTELYRGGGFRYAAGQGDVRIVLQPESCIRGTVTESGTGRPVPGVELWVEHGSVHWMSTGSQAVLSDDKGAFAVGSLAPGEHQETWNGVDGHGRRAGTGTYLIRVVEGNRSLATRVLLMR